MSSKEVQQTAASISNGMRGIEKIMKREYGLDVLCTPVNFDMVNFNSVSFDVSYWVVTPAERQAIDAARFASEIGVERLWDY